MPTKRIILFPQDKGGIGKSFVATLLYDYLTDVGVRLKAFDLDHANSTFNRLVPEAEFIDTDVDTDTDRILPETMNRDPDPSHCYNLRPRCSGRDRDSSFQGGCGTPCSRPGP